MIAQLKEHFTSDSAQLSLAISAGREGSRLSHSHQKQFQYVVQSLSLWREILHDMFKLWTFAELDLLSTTTNYRLLDTGQGLNRVQGAPRVGRHMHAILAKAQQNAGGWVGSSVVHLGDHNVPNALIFIDKYTQIHRILLPITQCLTYLDKLSQAKSEELRWVDATFGSCEKAKLVILRDFYRFGFDGSGADNFFDAGSCIDGRLTSAWNWCAKLEKKNFFGVFKLSGFTGFDGQF